MFFRAWCCEASVRESFQIQKDWSDTILFATYEAEGYEGHAYVFLIRHNKAYEVYGSHCSCFGLENQWDPQETTIDNLSPPSWLDEKEMEALRQIVDIAITRWGIR